MCNKDLLTDGCIIKVLQSKGAVGPTSVKGIYWHEDVTWHDVTEETTTTTTTTTSTTDVGWLENALRKAPAILRLLTPSTTPPTTTTSSSTPRRAPSNWRYPSLPLGNRRFPPSTRNDVDDNDDDNDSGSGANVDSNVDAIIAPPRSDTAVVDGELDVSDTGVKIIIGPSRPKTKTVNVADAANTADAANAAVGADAADAVDTANDAKVKVVVKVEAATDDEPVRVKTEPLNVGDEPTVEAATEDEPVHVKTEPLDVGDEPAVEAATEDDPVHVKTEPLHVEDEPTMDVKPVVIHQRVDVDEPLENDDALERVEEPHHVDEPNHVDASTPVDEPSVDEPLEVDADEGQRLVDQIEVNDNATTITPMTTTTTSSSGVEVEMPLEITATPEVIVDSPTDEKNVDAIIAPPRSDTAVVDGELDVSAIEAPILATTSSSTSSSSSSKILTAIRSKSPPLTPTLTSSALPPHSPLPNSTSKALPTTSGPAVSPMVAHLGTVVTYWYVENQKTKENHFEKNKTKRENNLELWILIGLNIFWSFLYQCSWNRHLAPVFGSRGHLSQNEEEDGRTHHT